MFRASSAHHQESLTVHTASSLCVCVCLQHCLVRNWLLVVRLSVLIVTNRSIQTDAPLKASFLQDSATDRHKHRNWRLYVRWDTPDDERLTLETCSYTHIKIKIYHKLHLLVYLLEYMKMHGSGNIKYDNTFPISSKQTGLLEITKPTETHIFKW
jgi:hypothetical protein